MAINFQDFGFIMYFLIKAMSNAQTMNFYLFLFFLFISITTFLTMRIMIFVWRVQNNFLNNNQINTSAFRKKFYLFQMKFYFLMLTYYSLMHLLFEYHPILIMISSLILYPQIVKNLSLQLHQFDKSYIIFFVFPRFFLLLYFRSCYKNIENIRPYPILSSISFLLFMLSVLIIYLQTQYGSYFFIPRCLRWKQFNYFIKADQLREQLLGKPDSSLDTSNASQLSGFKSLLSKLFKSKKKDLNTSERKSDEKTFDLSIMSKDSQLKSNSQLKSDSENQFIKMEESTVENIESILYCFD